MRRTLQPSNRKKLSAISGPAATETPITTTCRLLVKDKTTKRTFLIDTGADISVIPPMSKQTSINNSFPMKLYAANGTEIRTYGTQLLQIDFGMRRPFPWKFVVADVTHPIVSSDFLKHHHLVPDLKTRIFVDGKTFLKTPVKIDRSQVPLVHVIKIESSLYKDLLKKIPEIISVNSSLKCYNTTSAIHFIETTGRPVTAKARRLDPKRLEIAKKEFQFMLDQAYHQIRVNPADVPKTARNAAQTFQRYMDEVCRSLPFVFVYIDDVLIASKNEDEHINHLRTLFERLRQHGILSNLGKCTFGIDNIDFLGFNISSEGLKPTTSKVETIVQYP
ncbi:uncharacterized protein LOC142224767 [Haematobia irritans]|uniref:uncharacterized protein LOC142224767 n=1 Tax=Haematobia irritans TaxID=7368 RepID=UPI003F504677